VSIRFAALLVAAALLGGCASPLRMTLTAEQRASIQSLETKVVVIQDEVIVDVRPSNATGAGMMFGLVGALITTAIDSSVTNSRMKSAQELMVPFYTSIEDLDYRREFASALQASAADQPFKMSSITATPMSFTDEQLRKWRNALPAGQNLMLVVPRYRLSADFRTFDTETWVTIWDKGAQDQPINRSVLRYQSTPQGAGDAPSVLAWSANNAAAFRNAIRESLAETMDMMQADLKLGSTEGKAQAVREFPFLDNGALTQVRGSLVKEQGDRVRVLGEDGRLYSLPKSAAPAAPAAK
jgi:hypothetical protein